MLEAIGAAYLSVTLIILWAVYYMIAFNFHKIKKETQNNIDRMIAEWGNTRTAAYLTIAAIIWPITFLVALS